MIILLFQFVNLSSCLITQIRYMVTETSMVLIQNNIFSIQLICSFSIQTCNPLFKKCFSVNQTSSCFIQTCYCAFQISNLAIQNSSASKNASYPSIPIYNSSPQVYNSSILTHYSTIQTGYSGVSIIFETAV